MRTSDPYWLSVEIGKALEARRQTLVTVESCSGGWIAKSLTDVSGSSGWFDRGLVTYSNQAKQDLVGVKAGTLETQGAVSEAVVREMAQGGLKASPADWALSVSGIAGPTGGTKEKPVGLVWMAWAGRQGRLVSRSERFPGDREKIRRLTVIRSLQGLLDILNDQ